MLDGNVLLRQECDEVPKGTLSCPDRIMEVFYQLRHFEGAHLLLAVCGRKLIQQTLNRYISITKLKPKPTTMEDYLIFVCHFVFFVITKTQYIIENLLFIL